MPCLWRFAIEPEPLSGAAADLLDKAVLLLAGTPLHSARQTLTENSFCYILLHLGVYLFVFFTMLLLPGIAAAGVARDRRTGRLDDLITTTYSSTSIYTAKVIASSLPFCVAGGSLFVLMLPVMFAEHLDAAAVIRILVEMVGQIGLIAIVSVTCSCRCRHAATARVLAYFAVWLVFPFLWFCLVTTSKGQLRYPGNYPFERRQLEWQWTWEQFSSYRFLFQATLALLLAFVGIHRIAPRGRVKNVSNVTEDTQSPADPTRRQTMFAAGCALIWMLGGCRHGVDTVGKADSSRPGSSPPHGVIRVAPGHADSVGAWESLNLEAQLEPENSTVIGEPRVTASGGEVKDIEIINGNRTVRILYSPKSGINQQGRYATISVAWTVRGKDNDTTVVTRTFVNALEDGRYAVGYETPRPSW
jgi:hypothetical protein